MIDGYLAAYAHKLRTARKAHCCCECLGVIQPGEQYHYHSGIWEGSGVSYKICTDCTALTAKVDEGIPPDECTPFEGLSESVLESTSLENLRAYVSILTKRNSPERMRQRWEERLREEEDDAAP